MERWEESRVRDIPDEDRGRAGMYGVLAHLLGAPPDAVALASLARLRGDDSVVGRAIGALAEAAAASCAEDAACEYDALFAGLPQGVLRPYASYYRTGFLFEKPLAELRRDMAALGLARAEGVSEPEDHIASVCEIMHGLISGAYGPPAPLAAQRAFFEAHVAPWAPRFFVDLEQANEAAFYRPVGTVGRTFLAVEGEAFAFVG